VTLATDDAAAHVARSWDEDIVPALHDYIRIPNVSVAFDATWAESGHMAAATELLRAWCQRHADEGLAGATVEVQEIEGRTPLLIVDVPPVGSGTSDDTVLLYGHLDKQPPFTGWRDGLGPWEPVVDGDRLYGRGSADDGYSTFSAITALEAVRAAGGSHHRCIVLIEASEESGSPDLPAHLDALGDRLGQPSLVIALDSWCGDWDRLWITTSLRGLLDMTVDVEVLTEGVHSGSAGGVVPSSFRILRSLISRIEDERTGELLVRELHVDIPDQRLRQIAATAPDLGDFADRFPFAGDARPERPSTEQMLIARTWQPALEVVGIAGAPAPADAGNVLRPGTSVKLSVRVPPTADPVAAADAIERRLTADPPYGARVTVHRGSAEAGWHAPPETPWLARAVESASMAAFGAPPRSLGEGGTIPFMGMLGRRFPEAQFVITGVLGPESNAHGPNEFLHLPTAHKVTTAVAHILDAHARRPGAPRPPASASPADADVEPQPT
jgi:acetylornithine deacetylase/succinyl-diaminopimelate desuccinylase-like protein